jgi:hypothetical protein
MDASRALGNLLLMEPGEAVLPELRCTDVIGSPPIVLGQVCDGIEVARLGPGGQAPQWQVFQHAASARRHRYPPVREESHGSNRSTRIRRIDCRLRCGKKKRQAERLRARPESYRAAVSFNERS